jgi:DNA adenine methylase
VNAVTKPVLRYPGAKWGLAPWIISHFPPHEAYVEPFFGSGAVLLRKAPARSELVNDIDGAVVAFFRVLRDRPEDLARALALTPYAREELHQARDGEGDGDLEKARRLAIACWQTRGGALSRRRPGWRFDIHGAANQSHAGTWAMLPERVMAAALRLRHVAIDNRPALHILELARRRGDETLIYADPPYLGRMLAGGATAEQFRLYSNEMTLTEHAQLLDALDLHPGPVVLSGYPSALYEERLVRWSSVLRTTRNQVNDQRTEVLWLNDVAARHAVLPLRFAMTA